MYNKPDYNEPSYLAGYFRKHVQITHKPKSMLFAYVIQE